jgi:hypothetical protein
MIFMTLGLGASSAQAAIIHKFEPAPTAQIEKEARTCGTVKGPLEEVNALTVSPGEAAGEASHLWLAELRKAEEGGKPATREERVDEFDATSGTGCTQPITLPSSLRGADQGIAVGHHTSEREVYLGAAANIAGSPARVGVFGPSGVLQEAWTGSDTPNAGFVGLTKGVAVDESTAGSDWARGDVLVASSSNEAGVVDVFSPEADGKERYVRQLAGTCPSVGSVCSPTEEEANRFSCPPELEASCPQRVAVDPADGDVLVANGRVVDVFEPEGLGEYKYVRQISETTAGHTFNQTLGVAAGGGEDDGDIYVWEQTEPGVPGGSVDQFNREGVFLDSLTGTSTGPFDSVTSVAVDPDPASHDVFVGDQRGDGESAVDVFSPDVIVPNTTTEGAEETATTAVLHGSVNPLSEGQATCELEYGPTISYGQTVECAGPGSRVTPLASVTEELSVRSSLVSGLAPDTTYHYRLVAVDKNGSHAGDDMTFTTKGPGVVSASASEVTATSASLDATLDPHGHETSVFFQYSSESTEACTPSTCIAAPAEPGIGVGSGEEPFSVAQTVEGLAPGKLYHYRVVTVSDVEVTPGHVETHQFPGPDRTFITQRSGEVVLPDGRQWQLVSPPDKHGALIEALGQDSNQGEPIQAAANGGAITYLADVPTEAAPLGNSNHIQVFSARGPVGWSSHDLALPHTIADASGEAGNEYRFFSEDLSTGIVQPFGHFDPALSGEASEQTAYEHTDYVDGNPAQACASSCYQPLVTTMPGVDDDTASPFQPFGEYGPEKKSGNGEEGNRCPPYTICGPVFVGASPDATHVILVSHVPLAKGAGEGDLYEWNRQAPASQRLNLVSVLPPREGAGAVVATLGDNSENARGAVSANGTRVFFTATGSDGHTHLYMRDVTGGKTLRLDVPDPACVQEGVCGLATSSPEFQIASLEGERALFTDTARLTGNSGASTGKSDLYECAIAQPAAGEPTCTLTDLTPKAISGARAEVQGQVIGASEDGSWVYFVADGVLESGGAPVPGATRGTCTGGQPSSESLCDLYVRHEGTTHLVAVLSGEDFPDWSPGSTALYHLVGRVAPDGEWLAFMSARSLTGYDNRDVQSGKKDEEVYLYDAKKSGLICASCDPSGARPEGQEYGFAGQNMPHVSGNRVWESFSWLAADLPAWTPYQISDARYQSRYLSNSGRLFFNARDSLVPQAVNHTWDVYEYEPEGAGSEAAKCGPSSASGSEVFQPSRTVEVEDRAIEASAGCVGLISSGESPDESAFLDASESGGDVFFLTTAQLSKQDYDNDYDVYDAHECTASSPCLPESATEPPPCTTADSCRAASPPQPEVFGAPASATFNGPGNVTPPPAKPAVKKKTAKCKKHFARNKKGKCVRVKRKSKSKKSSHGKGRA